MKMNNDFSILMLVVVVAVVGVVALFMISSPGRSVVPYSSTVLAGENVAGQGFKAMAVASNSIKTDNSIASLETKFSKLDKVKLSDLKEPVEPSDPLFVTNDMLQEFSHTRGCFVLTQFIVDTLSVGVDALTINLPNSGCVSLNSDLHMTIPIVLRGSTVFKGEGYSLLGPGIDYTNPNVGIYTYDSTKIQNLDVEHYYYGFLVSDNSTVSGSSADNNQNGFRMYGSSTVSGSSADNNDYGFYMYGSSAVSGSSAENNYCGFYIHDHSTVSDSSADNNDYYGFAMSGSSTVSGSSADNNKHYGFWMYGSSTVSASSADNNERGFWMQDSSIVSGSSADNNPFGFLMYHHSTVSDSSASGSTNVGFDLHDSSAVTGVKSLNNHLGLYVPSGASVSATGRFCDNTDNDIKINCAVDNFDSIYCGSLSGSVRADKLDGSVFSGLTVSPCHQPLVARPVAVIKR